MLNDTSCLCLFRLHLLTKHRVFSGPGFQLAQELGEAANGGQVLLSQEAWVRLRGSMFAAGFPVVEQLGLYKLDAWPVPIWVYQVSIVTQQPGRHLYNRLVAKILWVFMFASRHAMTAQQTSVHRARCLIIC